METQDVGSFGRCVCQPDKHESKFSSRYRKSFLYFCGICWRQIREADETDLSGSEILAIYMKALGEV
jgi:hypothetical protein